MFSSDACSDRHPGLAVFILAMGTFILGITEFATMPMLPLIAESLDATPSVAGNVISAYAMGVVIGAPALMLMTSKMPRRTALILFALLMALSNGLSAIADSVNELFIYRVLCGLPHGAYFGTALLLAAEMAPAGKRASAMAKVFFGLTFATIIGVPLFTLIGQASDWRLCMVIVAMMALVTSGLIYRYVPLGKIAKPSSLLDEISVLKDKLVWSILGIVIIGFGGVFCIYTYMADTILNVTQAPEKAISVAMAMFGIGTTFGNWLCAKAADKHPLTTTGTALLLSILISVCYVQAAHNIWLLYAAVFCLGASVGLAAVIQSMLMDAAPHAHSMVGALVQCAFNTANAIGPWVGGMVIAQGANFNMTGYTSAALFAGGLFMWFLSYLQLRKPQGCEAY